MLRLLSRQRDQNDLGAFAAHAQHPVAMFLPEVSDAGASGFEDPQAGQPKHGHQRAETLAFDVNVAPAA